MKKIFLPLALMKWPLLSTTIDGAHKGDRPVNELFRFTESSGFFVAYDTLEALRKDFPDAEYETRIVPIPPGAAPQAFLDVKRL